MCSKWERSMPGKDSEVCVLGEKIADLLRWIRSLVVDKNHGMIPSSGYSVRHALSGDVMTERIQIPRPRLDNRHLSPAACVAHHAGLN